jgi:hypothetical protein
MDSWFFPSFSPLNWIIGLAESGKGERTQRGSVLRLIQIRKVCAVYAELVRNSSSQASPNFDVGRAPDTRDRSLGFEKRGQLFIRTHNEAPGVLTLCGHNPKLSAPLTGA